MISSRARQQARAGRLFRTAVWVLAAVIATTAGVRSEPVGSGKGSDGDSAGVAAISRPPANLVGQFGPYKSLLAFDDGRRVERVDDWKARRAEIRARWEAAMGRWPDLIERPAVEIVSRIKRENFFQYRVKIEIAHGQRAEGYLLVPEGQGPFPAVFVPYYDPETSIGAGREGLRDYAHQMARRGYVSLAIGSPGGDARRPDIGSAQCQPLSFLAYVAANCANALAQLPEVDARRIGVVGHSYGGKWAMFAAALNERYACGAWSDPGIVFDETRSNVNYWEPWYLGMDSAHHRKLGIPSKENPRTGAYKRLFEAGHDLHEILALMVPRPFLVSGGAEDPPERWQALNRVVEVSRLFGHEDRVWMTNRQGHAPTEESNAEIYRFFDHWLKGHEGTGR